jgi:hypothetical protein
MSLDDNRFSSPYEKYKRDRKKIIDNITPVKKEESGRTNSSKQSGSICPNCRRSEMKPFKQEIAGFKKEETVLLCSDIRRNYKVPMTSYTSIAKQGGYKTKKHNH